MSNWKNRIVGHEDVPGYEGRYKASPDGKIFAVDRRVAAGHGFRTAYGHELKQTFQNSGYLTVGLHKNCKFKRFLVHRIIVETFLRRIEKSEEVNHINGKKTDNRIENLEIVTRKQNIWHAIKIGLMNLKGENNPSAKLTQKQVDEIRRDYKFGGKRNGGDGYRGLSEKYGVSWELIRDIIKGRIWKNSNRIAG